MYNENDIKLIENKIEEIFNRYTNDDFENLVPVPFIYKNTIRFVPQELANEVRNLIDIYEKHKKNIKVKRLKY